MGRGFLSGLVWGSILSAMLVWMASQMSGMVDLLKAPEQVAVTAPEAVSPVPVQDTATPVPAESTAPSMVAAPQGREPEGGEVDAAPQAETASAVAPETSEATAAPQEPSGGDAPSAPAAIEAPAPVTAAGQVPATAEIDTSPQVTAAAPVPEFTQPIVVVPEISTAQTVLSEPQPKADASPDTANVVAEAPTLPEADLPPVSEAAPQNKPVSKPETAPVPEVIAKLEPPAEIESTPEQPADSGVAPGPEEAPADAGSVGTLGAGGGLVNLAPEVKVNRLPTIGGQTEAATPEVEAEPDAVPMGPAITRFAAPFDNPDNRPIMAILLIDEGGVRQSIEEMAAFPFPISYVVDASRPDAAEAMADYRAAGHEVVAMTPLPDGATPQDVEVSFETYLARMPEVVAVMDTQAAAFQSSRQVASQVAQIMADNGMGMITFSKGLNTATQLASREGVPAKLVFREFDNAGQNGAAIKRFLDQAAFRAGQQSGVILVGHNRPDTVTAVLEWGLGNRAATLALAPISAALLVK